MKTIANLIRKLRPNIEQMLAYESARSLVTSEAKDLIYLDANESSADESLPWNRYPEPQPAALKQRLSEIYDVPLDQILVGRGSDEAIDLLTRAFCRPEIDSVLYFPPTYGMYRVSAQIQGARCLELNQICKKNQWQLDWKKIAETISTEKENLKLIFLCQPNNPTGHVLAISDVLRLLEMASNTCVVIDEAYIEFSKIKSCVELLERFPNLIILRTLSKAWSLAALRVGVILAQPKIIQYLNKVRAPYPLPKPVVDEVLIQTTPKKKDVIVTRVNQAVQRRNDFAKSISQLSFVRTIFPSEGNFLLIEVHDSSFVMAEARKAGFVLRDRNQDPNLANCIRITIGNTAEMKLLQKFLKDLDSSLKKEAQREKIPFY